MEPGLDDSAPRLPTLELLDDPETEATLEPPVKKVKKEKLEIPEKNDNLDDLLGDVYDTKVEKPRPILQRIEDEVHSIQIWNQFHLCWIHFFCGSLTNQCYHYYPGKLVSFYAFLLLAFPQKVYSAQLETFYLPNDLP